MADTEQTSDNPEQQESTGDAEQEPKGDEKPGPKGKKPKDDEGAEGPCKDRDDDGGPDEPAKSRCKCTGHCHCDCEMDLPTGSIRRILEELRKELKVPDVCDGVSKDAKNDFEKALDECDKEYQGFDAIVKSYHDYHCAIDCEIDKAEGWCKDIETWCEQLDEDTRKCIKALWKDFYEEEEHDLLCCCWMPARHKYEMLGDCLEQAKGRETITKEDFDKAKNFLAELKARFDDLKKLYDEAKKHLDAKEPKKVCAVLHEFRKVYHGLDQLVLWRDQRKLCKKAVKIAPDTCEPPKLKKRDSDWLRGCLNDALKSLIGAKYRRYCWHQQKLDAECLRDDCKKRLDEFREKRRTQFVLEAQDCPETLTQTAD